LGCKVKRIGDQHGGKRGEKLEEEKILKVLEEEGMWVASPRILAPPARGKEGRRERGIKIRSKKERAETHTSGSVLRRR